MAKTKIEKQQAVVVCGGSGYIGSECCHQLTQKGYHVVNIDKVVKGNTLVTDISMHERAWIPRVVEYFTNNDMEVISVICFAALKSLPESLSKPLDYYENNLKVLTNSLKLAKVLKVKSFIFSSSASVYSRVQDTPFVETDPIGCCHPYGQTKIMGERIVADVCSELGIKYYNLRYFNPIGYTAVTKDTTASLFGSINKCIENKVPLTVFGDKYNTKDGTCIRDFIDIRDLVDAHMFFVQSTADSGEYNVGTGVPNTVLDIVKAVKDEYPEFEYMIGAPRPGDEPGNYADTTKINKLGWKPKYSIVDAIRSLIQPSQAGLEPYSCK